MKKQLLLLEKYPERNGIAIPAIELGLPETELDLSLENMVSNHHDCFAERKFGRDILYLTLRNLEVCQSIQPNDVHNYIHSTYEPPALPRPFQAYQFILESLSDGARLRTGSANKPEYEIISDILLERVHQNYKKLKSR